MKCKLLSLFCLGAVVVLPIEAGARVNYLSNQNAVSNTMTNNYGVIVNGAIAPNTSYTIIDINRQIVAQGKSDGNGIFFEELEKVNSQGDNRLTLKYKGNVEEINTNGLSLVSFSSNNFNSDNLLLTTSMLQSDFASAFSVGNMLTVLGLAALDQYGYNKIGIGVVTLLLSGIFNSPDETQQKLDEILDNTKEIKQHLDEIDKKLDVQFQMTSANFNMIFKSQLDDKVLSTSDKKTQLNNYLSSLQNKLQQEQYDAFWEANPQFKELNKLEAKEYEQQLKMMWQKLDKYDDDNNISDKKSISRIMLAIDDDLKREGSFNASQVLSHFNNLASKVSNIATSSQVNLQDSFIASINGTGIVTQDDISAKRICDGNSRRLIYLNYLSTLDMLNDLLALQLAVTDFGISGRTHAGIIEEYAKAMIDLDKFVKEALDTGCDSFDGSASGWPDVTFLPVQTNGHSTLVVKVPLTQSLDLPQAKHLIFDNDDNAKEDREKYLSSTSVKFINKLLTENHDTSVQGILGYKASYDADKQNIIAVYALKRPQVISNEELLLTGEESADDQTAHISSAIECDKEYQGWQQVANCKFKLGGLSADKVYTFYANDDENSQQEIVGANGSEQDVSLTLKYNDINTLSHNMYYALHDGRVNVDKKNYTLAFEPSLPSQNYKHENLTAGMWVRWMPWENPIFEMWYKGESQMKMVDAVSYSNWNGNRERWEFNDGYVKFENLDNSSLTGSTDITFQRAGYTQKGNFDCSRAGNTSMGNPVTCKPPVWQAPQKV